MAVRRDYIDRLREENKELYTLYTDEDSNFRDRTELCARKR